MLYTGTPCQIAGLKGFLGKEYRNLVTADIVCHGVGSQAFFDKYMEYLHQKNGKIKELRFRDKEFAGWSCGGALVVANGSGPEIRKAYFDYNNYYYYYFLHGDIYRESCYTCKYAGTDRPGDFTMGDFWGVESCDLCLDTSDGCSLVIANTEKARERLNDLCHSLELVKVTAEQATRSNAQLIRPSLKTGTRERLAAQFASMTGSQMDAAFRRQNKKQIFKLHIKALVPYKLKLKIRKMR